jgi:hypothetical protein
MKLTLVRTKAKQKEDATSSKSQPSQPSQPSKGYVNVTLVNMQPRYGGSPKGKIRLYDKELGPITYKRLKQEIELVFGIYGCSYDLYLNFKKLTRTLDDTPVEQDMFNEQTLEVWRSNSFVKQL